MDTNIMRREFKHLYTLCPLNGYSSINIGSFYIQKDCYNRIKEFDQKYGIGRYDELKSWTGWFSSYFFK